MNPNIDVPLTKLCAANAATLALTVRRAEPGDTQAMLSALVIAETIQSRLSSFIDRTRLALGIHPITKSEGRGTK